MSSGIYNNNHKEQLGIVDFAQQIIGLREWGRLHMMFQWVNHNKQWNYAVSKSDIQIVPAMMVLWSLKLQVLLKISLLGGLKTFYLGARILKCLKTKKSINLNLKWLLMMEKVCH